MGSGVSVHVIGARSIAKMSLIVLIPVPCAVIVALSQIRIRIVRTNRSTDLSNVGGDGTGSLAATYTL